MKIAKFFGAVFGAIGTVLLIGSIGLCLVGLNMPAKVEQIPEGAVQCTARVEEAMAQGDFAALESHIYGQPDLGLEGAPQEAAAAQVWELVKENLFFVWNGDCYEEDGTYYREAMVTYLDLAGITDDLPTLAHALLTQRVEAATDMAELYDGGEFREDVMDQVMADALDQACRENKKLVTVRCRMELVFRDGQWWIVPDGALLTALSAGLV